MPTDPTRHESIQGYQQLEHPADLALRFWAPSEEELLVVAARAVVDLLTEGATVGAEQTQRVRLESVDAEDRFVRWLNEVLVLATVDGFLLADARLQLHDDGLEAELSGQAGASELVQHELKGVTYHDLELRCDGPRFVGRIVIDV